MILTAFGTSSSLGTLNSRPQARHLILLSAAAASISQLLLQSGHRAIIRIATPFAATAISVSGAIWNLTESQNIIAAEVEEYPSKSTSCPIMLLGRVHCHHRQDDHLADKAEQHDFT